MLSPVYADLKGLPPIYIQAGSSEAIIDQVRAFVDTARGQGAQIRLNVWEGMTHAFQAYGDKQEPSREALQRMGQAIDARLAAGAGLGREGRATIPPGCEAIPIT